MTRACVTCGATFEPIDHRRRTCSTACQYKLIWANRPRGESYTKLYLPGHPLANDRDAVGEHRAALYAKLGLGSHPCHWCGAVLEWRSAGDAQRRGSIKVDHLDGDPRNNNPANLVPSCNGCNVRRGLSNQITKGELFIVRGGKRLRAERRTCELCGAEFLHRIAARNPGLYCSKSCAVRASHAKRRS
jgi:DNA-directed RNA polymerase subunit RPC12/RpoP